MENAIKIANFYYQYLFKNFSMTIEKNKFYMLSGPNNCGKTTLIRVLNREIIIEDNIEILGEPINSYSIDTYAKLVGCVIPLEFLPKEINLEEELALYSSNDEEIDEILKGLKIKRMIHKEIKELSSKEFILYQLAVALIKKPKILLVDSIYSYFPEKDLMEILSFLKEYQKKKKMTVFYIARNLKESLYADYLYIMDDKKISQKGKTLEVLEKDNVINKIGLDLPFMMDLSVKLKDYDLLKKIELEKDGMVDLLWK